MTPEDDLRQQLEQAENDAERLSGEVAALQRFKAYVHKRLDDAGIPTHPDGPHSKEGCRIGDRLDIALGGYALARLGADLITHWAEGDGSIDGFDLIDMLKATHAIEEIPGGFDSDIHEAGNHNPEEGDPWLAITTPVQLAMRKIKGEQFTPVPDAKA